MRAHGHVLRVTRFVLFVDGDERYLQVADPLGRSVVEHPTEAAHCTTRSPQGRATKSKLHRSNSDAP